MVVAFHLGANTNLFSMFFLDLVLPWFVSIGGLVGLLITCETRGLNPCLLISLFFLFHV